MGDEGCEMRVLICGSREWSDRGQLHRELTGLYAEHPFWAVIVGDARGADTMALGWALGLRITADVFHANWNRDGRRAGLIRNLKMLDEKPDLVVAFLEGKSSGTMHTVHNARKRGLTVQTFGHLTRVVATAHRPRVMKGGIE